MTEFKVGDEVTLNTRAGARATVEYGPYGAARETYLVKLLEGEDEGDIFPSLAYIMKPAPKFAVGDKVTSTSDFRGAVCELVAGPFKSIFGHTFWVVEGPGGTHSGPHESTLTKVTAREIKVGDRVRVVRAKWASERHGKVGTVVSVTETWTPRNDVVHPFKVKFSDGDSINAAEVELVDEASATNSNTHTVNGVAYDLTARYRDKDGDRWRFKRFGSKVTGSHPDDEPEEDSWTLEYIVHRWAPLTRI